MRTPIKDSLGAPLTIVRRRIRILPLEFYENLLRTLLIYLLTDSLRDSAKGADDEFSEGLF